MWEIKGIANNINQPIMGLYTKKKRNWWDLFSQKKILQIDSNSNYNILAGICPDKLNDKLSFPNVGNLPIEQIKELEEDDILSILPNGKVTRIWESKASQNLLFVTERCNSACIMCPQPQKPIDYSNEVLNLISKIKVNKK